LFKNYCNSEKEFCESIESAAKDSGSPELSLENCASLRVSGGTMSGPGYGPNCEASGPAASCDRGARSKLTRENSFGVGIVFYPHFSVEGFALFDRAIAAAKIDGFFNLIGFFNFESTLGVGLGICGIAGAEVGSSVGGELKLSPSMPGCPAI
jgi:hypothetical protein